MAPSRSTSLSYTQLDGLHPCWQYPHGTNSHVAQAPVGEGVGSGVGCPVGVLLGALVVVGASLVVGTTDGALLGQGVGVPVPQYGGDCPALKTPSTVSHPLR